MTNEEFYDKVIAPNMMDIARTCQERGMSIVAMVEYEHGESGETCYVAPDASIKAIVAQWGVKCHGNVDSLMIAAQRHGRENGHSSLVLKMLGVPLSREDKGNG